MNRFTSSHLLQILSASSDFVFACREDGQVVSYEGQWESFFKSHTSADPCLIFNWIHPDDRSHFQSLFSQVKTRPIRFEARIGLPLEGLQHRVRWTLIEEPNDHIILGCGVQTQEAGLDIGLDTVLDRTSPACLFLAPDARLISCNQAAKALVNLFSHKSLQLKSSLFELWPTLDVENLKAHINECRSGKTFLYEQIFNFGAANSRWLQVSGQPVFTHDGKVNGIAVLLLDVTQAKETQLILTEKTEEAIEASRQFYGMIDSTQDLIIAFGTNYKILIANAAFYLEWYQIHNKPYDLTKTYLENCSDRSEEAQLEIKSLLDRALSGESLKMTREYQTANYHKFFDSSFSPIYGGAGKIVGVINMNRDVTSFIATQESLKQTQELLDSLLRHAPLPVYVAGRDGKIILTNPAFESVFEISQKQIQDLNRALPLESAETFQLAHEKVWQADRPLMQEEILKTRSGDRHFQTIRFSLPYVFKSVEPIVGILLDTTEQKNLEQQLLQSQKMESLGRLAGGIAHDFNNLLAVILGNNQMVLQGLHPAAPMFKYSNKIKTTAQRAAELVRRILTFSRQDLVNLIELDLNKSVRDSAELLTPILGENIYLKIECSDGPGLIHADMSQIMQTIMNLALNARDAMPDGGTLLIQSRPAQKLDIEAENGRVADGDYQLLIVRDTGSGMTPLVLQKMYEPFFTTKEVGQGTGLGLSTVYGVVEQSKGIICVSSQIGQGTTFRIYFPRINKRENETDYRDAGSVET